MATFATVDNTNLQAKEMANEIILSYSEHRQVVGHSAVSAIANGGDAQDKTLWLAMQEWLIANCTRFVNNSNSPNHYANTAEWLSVAGLNSSGFSRYKDNVLIGYGNMQKGDDRCIVNFQELQDGFSALKNTWASSGSWTGKGESNTKKGDEYHMYGHYDPPNSFAQMWAYFSMIADSPAAYAGCSRYSSNAAPCAWCAAAGTYATWGNIAAQYIRRYAYAGFTWTETSSMVHAVDLYIRHDPDGVFAWRHYHSPTYWNDFQASSPIFSANGDSVTEGYSVAQSWGNSNDTVYESNRIGNSILPIPSSTSEPSWSAVEPIGGNSGIGYQLDTPIFVLKWDFTNIN